MLSNVTLFFNSLSQVLREVYIELNLNNIMIKLNKRDNKTLEKEDAILCEKCDTLYTHNHKYNTKQLSKFVSKNFQDHKCLVCGANNLFISWIQKVPTLQSV